METEVVNGIVQLGQYGTVGVILALILLVALIGWLFFKFASNHVNHSNEAFNKNTEALTKLKDVIEYKLKSITHLY